MIFPTLNSLSQIFFADDEICTTWLIEHGILDRVEFCSKCGGEVRLSNSMYHCRSRNCRLKRSLYHNSFFSRSKLSCNEVMLIGYLWLGGSCRDEIMRYTGHSPNTVTAYLKYYRELVSSSLNNEDTMIGGEGVVVELDESKFGKRKYNRGHRVEGVWVLGGVERTVERQIFVEIVADRSAQTLLEVIARHVKPGSIIHTDLWKGYSEIESVLGNEHRTVNHSIQYVASDDTHTNTIEGTWNGLKMKIAVRNRNKNDMNDCLLEFIWRRKHREDLWEGLISALQNVSFID
jgi:transposase-like protein